MKASDLLVKCLEREGVDTVFAVPGEENLDVLDSLRQSRIAVVVCRHEQAAGFMAATAGRVTGKAGVCLATLGPGACNLVTAVAHATLGAMPMVVITGQKPVRKSLQGEFQLIDVVQMFQPVTKYTRQVVGADNIPARVREAFRRAEQERPGAAHLEIPEDVAADTTDAEPIAPSYARRPVAEDKAIAAAVELIQSSRTPLLLLGAGANRKTSSKLITQFVDRLGIPFATTQMGKGVVDETHPLHVGCAALSEGDFVHRSFDAADLIINVGHDVVEKPPFIMSPGGGRVIHVNYVSAQVDAIYHPDLEVTGDIANSFWRLGDLLHPQAHWDFSVIDRVRLALRAHVAEGSQSERFPLRPERVVADIASVLSEHDTVVLDNGLYKIWFARNFSARRTNALVLDNALATMGAGMPGAMAIARLRPTQRVVAVCGDGGFMMNSQELETAVRLGLSLVVVVLRDDGYGMIRWKQESMGFPDFGLGFSNVDFVAYAEAYGARGHRVASAGDLPGLLTGCFDAGGIHVIEVPIDYSDCVQVLTCEIQRLSAQV